MLADWSTLSDDTQLYLASEAMREARAGTAIQADTLADAFDDGSLPDRGGADALRLMAALLRQTLAGTWPAGARPAGHA